MFLPDSKIVFTISLINKEISKQVPDNNGIIGDEPNQKNYQALLSPVRDFLNISQIPHLA